jgi:hypothetical protein
MEIKELERWIKKQTEFLIKNQDYSGSWKKLDDYFSVVVFWEEGWGKEKRNDVIQHKDSPDFGLVISIKVHDHSTSLEDWYYPWLESEDGGILIESTGISQKEDFESLSKYILEQYKSVKGHVPDEKGRVSFDSPPEEIASFIEPDEQEVKEAKTKKDTVKLEPLSKKEELSQLESELSDFLTEQGTFVDNLNVVGGLGGTIMISMDITGDWKHDHLRTEHTVDEWLTEAGYVVNNHIQIESEDPNDDSDSYTAKHTWKISPKEID